MLKSPSPWWHPSVHRDRRPALMVRNRLLAGLRAHFVARDFVEVEPAALQVSPGNETHLHAFATELVDPDLGRRPFYLHTSPEFACKRLLAAGEPRIFAAARVFRNRERTALHHPEFTMVEWYRAHEPFTVLMRDCVDLLRLAAEIGGLDRFRFRELEMDPRAEPDRLSLTEAFARLGIDLLATVEPSGRTDRSALAAAAQTIGVRTASDDSWSDVFARVLADRIEPRLGHGRATILYGYPVPEAALARPSPDDPRVAERFELYACGVELANAFGELTDAAEQRRRFQADMALKERLYGERYPVDEDFLAALSCMPEASGIALGFDRLAMLAAGASRLDQVIWTPVA